MALGLGEAARQVMKIETSTGKFLVLGMDGREELGRLPEYHVRLAGNNMNLLGMPEDVEFEDLLGTATTVTMEVDEENPREFNGYITRMQQGEPIGRYPSFTATIRPWLWFATRSVNSRVFQEKTVKDIVTEVLDTYNGGTYEFRLASASVYPKLDYCVQYQESDFDFVSRLLEYFGIYYFFEHADGKHTMVLLDALAKHKSKPIKEPVRWANSMKYSWTVMNWRTMQEARSAKAVVRDYDYLEPATKIEATETPGSSNLKTKKLGDSEVFEFPGLVVQNSVKEEANSQPTSDAVKQRSKMLMQELTSMQAVATGTTNTYDVTVGATFKLDGHPRDAENVNYVVVSAQYRIEFADHEAIDDLKRRSPAQGFVCDMTAISMKGGDFRPARSTPKPRIHGPQTAIVVGDSGNEIETDKHGRIKVQFPWDRLGKKDKDSSGWVRVAQPWAGKSFGMFGLPRVGHEVVVQFIDGDPDRPLVTGSVYNNDNMAPWKLPDQSTVNGLKTQSSKGGDVDTANELRFDDKKDSEYVWFQAQKDFHRLVRNDAFDFVGNNESVKVVLTRNEVIGENWFLDVTKDVMHNLGNDLHVNVAGDIFYTGAATYQMKIDKDMSGRIGGDLGLSVGGKTQLKSMGDIVVQSTTGKLSLKAGDTADMLAEAMTIKIKGAMTVALEGSMGVSLKCGGSFVSVGPAGVDISGPLVKINSGGSGAAASAALKASPAAPTDAKKEELLTPAKKADYEDMFKDPLPHDEGGSNGPVA